MVVDVKKLIGKCCNRIVNIAFGVCIAIIVFLMLQLFFVTSFKIPSDSMEPVLQDGDYILVDKCQEERGCSMWLHRWKGRKLIFIVCRVGENLRGMMCWYLIILIPNGGIA